MIGILITTLLVWWALKPDAREPQILKAYAKKTHKYKQDQDNEFEN